jgi:hypothetical protein
MTEEERKQLITKATGAYLSDSLFHAIVQTLCLTARQYHIECLRTGFFDDSITDNWKPYNELLTEMCLILYQYDNGRKTQVDVYRKIAEDAVANSVNFNAQIPKIPM